MLNKRDRLNLEKRGMRKPLRKRRIITLRPLRKRRTMTMRPLRKRRMTTTQPLRKIRMIRLSLRPVKRAKRRVAHPVFSEHLAL